MSRGRSALGVSTDSSLLFDLFHLLLDVVQRFPIVRRQLAFKRIKIVVLLKDQVFQGPGVSGEDNDAGHFRGLLRDARRGHGPKAVARDKNLLWLDGLVRPEQRHGCAGVVDGFVLECEVFQRDELGRMRLRSLGVAQDGYSLRSQSPGQVTERLVWTNGFISIMRPGAMHQDNGRERSVSPGQRQV